MTGENLFCSYTGTCELYLNSPSGDRVRFDIIENISGNYSCTMLRTLKLEDPSFGYRIGKECSHIRLLNLLSKLQK